MIVHLTNAFQRDTISIATSRATLEGGGLRVIVLLVGSFRGPVKTVANAWKGISS